MKLQRDPNLESALEKLQRSSLKIKGKGNLLRLYQAVLRYLSSDLYKKALESTEELIQVVKAFPQYPNSLDSAEREIHSLRSGLMLAFNQTEHSIRGAYLPDDELKLGFFVDGCVSFVDKIDDKIFPGFEVDDGKGGKRRCLIRYMSTLKLNDIEKLCIAEIKDNGKLVYLDPRVEEGDIIWVVVQRIAKDEKGDPYFRMMKYDGFLKDCGDIKPQVNGVYKSQVFYYRYRVKADNGRDDFVIEDLDHDGDFRIDPSLVAEWQIKQESVVKSLGVIFAKPLDDLTGQIGTQELMRYRNEILRRS